MAFVVAKAVGLETGAASSDYIQMYGGDKDALTASLTRIQKVSAEIIDAVACTEPSTELVELLAA